MGKNHSKFGLPSAGKKRENPEGGTYVLNGCVNGRFRNSEECVWSNAATSGSPARFTLGPDTPENLKTCQCENEQSPVGFAEDNCRFEVALPPEVTGSACSVKVYAMEERDSVCKPPLSPSNGKVPSGAVDYNVSLDRESDQQEWSFTLYDFDGHRRVTREDLSSVLKSISEALSTTVTLPPCGSKRLHLRLSVMPDKETEEQEKVQKKSILPLEGKDTNGTQAVPDSKQTETKTEQATTPAAECAAPTATTTAHVHRRHHHHHHHGRRDGVARSSKRHSRSQPNQGDAGNLEIKSPDKRHSRLRKHQSSHRGTGASATVEPAATAAAAAVPTAAAATAAPATATATSEAPAARHHSSSNNTTKEPSTPETPCTVIVNELTAENLANHDNQERRSDENRERRSYYQELAGIENTCNKEEEPEILTPAQVVKLKHTSERTKSKHHRNGHQQGGSPHHRRSKVYEIDLPLDQLDRTARNAEKPKGAADYHMNLLEASRARLENQQPVVPVTTPLTPENGADIGAVVMHRKEQRRRHHHNGSKSKRPTTLQPFMLFEHELTSTHDRQVFTSPTLHRHDHHHHHEHHHHYHYHHYHT